MVTSEKIRQDENSRMAKEPVKNNFVNSNSLTNNKTRNNPNIFSSFFFWWVFPVIVTGNKKNLEEDDLIVPPEKYDSDILGDYLERYWFMEYESAVKKNRKPKLWKALFRAYWLSYMPGAFFVVIQAVLRTYQPQLFAQLLSYWSVESGLSRKDAGFYALAMLGVNFGSMMCQHHHALFVARFGMRVKVACSSLIYRKLLRMSQNSVNDVAGGKVVNLLSNDVARFDYAFKFIHHLWVVPIQAAVVLYFTYELAGWAPYVGLFGVVIVMLPVQAGLTKLASFIRRETAQRTDKRIKIMSEIINGIQVIKMYAWEKPFQAIIRAARAYELRSLKKAIFVRSVLLGFVLFTERIILFLTSLTLILTGTNVTATLIYPIQQYFSVIQINLTLILPFTIVNISEMLVSLDRIQSVLVMDERNDLTTFQILKRSKNGTSSRMSFNKPQKSNGANNIVPNKMLQNKNGLLSDLVSPAAFNSTELDYCIELLNVSASWADTNELTKQILSNINLRLSKSQLCAVVGPVGSGKSSLLQVILKELPLSNGYLNINGKVSYACQESWLFSATVRDNILFGLPYESRKYMEVCRVCCLLPDFKQLPNGDLSLVGERGVSLSGGQRTRINLARAVYRDADVYLLDDPLSAVDANVGRMLFENCIKGYLRNRTIILVTHQVHFIKSAEIIVILNEGAIENVGKYDDLMKTGKEFSRFLARQEREHGDAGHPKKRLPTPFQRGLSKISIKDEYSFEIERKQIHEAEERIKGNLKFDVVWQYLKAVQSWFLVFLSFFWLVLAQVAAKTADYWISYWTNAVDEYEQGLPENQALDANLDTQMGALTTGQYLIVYGGVVLSVIVFTQMMIISFVNMSIQASANLHDNIYKKLIVATMKFFDTNPSGHVLNRFSKDIGAIDEFLPRSMLETVQMYLSMISLLVLNAVSLPWTVIPTVIVIILFIFLLKWYLNAAQAIKRLEGTTKNPVFGMINTTISGLSTIRSSNAQDRLLKKFDNAQNLHSSAFYTFIGSSNAFGLCLDSLCLAYFGVIVGLFPLIDFSSLIPVGSVGLAVSQSMVLTMMLQMAARYTADFLGHMTAVERVLEYTHLPTEENINEGPTTPPKEWPAQGNVKFERVFLKYGADDPPVLKNLNIDIKSGWKVGVVGRTGAGKSSLISALFRLYNIDGSITIDDVDTQGLFKQDLRSKISIIPQEPVLFSATLRYNLDPFDSYSDDALWRALEQVELKEAVPALDFKVSEGGANFSMGQRQLVCLARAVLRSNKILVMDEATANVDPQTDALIQKTIRREFADCTVITIAHRLNTIMDSDRVLVMDKGVAAEFDHPHLLLNDSNSIFNFMVKETGESMSRLLYDKAKTKYDSLVL